VWKCKSLKTNLKSYQKKGFKDKSPEF